MFCKKCGRELEDGTNFCPYCGTQQSVNAGENVDGGSKRQSIFSKIWNHPLFTKVAIKFGNVLEILEGVIFLILSRLLFQEGGFWGIVFGILFVLGGIGSCFNGVTSLLHGRTDTDRAEPLDETDIRKKKRNLCIGIVVMIIALIVLKKSGGGTYYIVQSVSFDNMGSETIGELVEENLKSPEWSKKKLDNSSELVYVEGYCPAYGETVQIEFYCEKLDDGSHEVSIKGMSMPESGGELNAFETSIAWAAFYHR